MDRLFQLFFNRVTFSSGVRKQKKDKRIGFDKSLLIKFLSGMNNEILSVPLYRAVMDWMSDKLEQGTHHIN